MNNLLNSKKGLNSPQRIAIVGTGISGLTAAYLSSQSHDITVYEANSYIGGHTHTVHVSSSQGTLAIDTGFIVFNDRTYPNFLKILNQLGVDFQSTSMSFSVHDTNTDLEYNGTSINKLFAQRSNLFRPQFYRLLFDILRFNNCARALLKENDESITLREFFKKEKFSKEVFRYYIIPMGAALWSANPRKMNEFPARYFAQFFENHGLLGFGNKPNWFVIKGGSKTYVEAMVKKFSDKIRLDTPVRSIRRHEDGVDVFTDQEKPERYDYIILACHSNQALTLLSDPSHEEQDILSAIQYQSNSVILHTDTSLLPKRRLAWGAWNYRVPSKYQDEVLVTYDMNILQTLTTKEEFCVTLNGIDYINQDRIISKFIYHHPVYTVSTLNAQKRRQEINGKRRTFFAGAYWGFGFHEDGVNSALTCCSKLGMRL